MKIKQSLRWLLPCLLALWIHVPAVLACLYNIRDVAYVRLEGDAYRLFLYVSRDTTPDVRRFLENEGSSVFMDSNIQCRVIDIHGEKNDPALELLPENHGLDFPVALLMPARETLKPIIFSLPEIVDGDGDGDGLNGLLHSPLRREMVRQLVEPYCMVLLIEARPEAAANEIDTVKRADAETTSKAEAANEKAVAANLIAEAEIAEAIATIEKLMPSLPRPDHAPAPIEQPPCLLKLPFAKRDSESVLLWSLELDALASDETACVVLYGRGRRIGPVLTGSEIVAATLTRILSVVGQDCECNLPRAWMRGPTVPLEWNRETRTATVRQLGFDPDSPMVRAEVAMIVGRKPEGPGQEMALHPADPGYREIAVDLQAPSRAEDRKNPEAAAEPSSEISNMNTSLFLLLAFVVIELALVVVVRARRKKA